MRSIITHRPASSIDKREEPFLGFFSEDAPTVRPSRASQPVAAVKERIEVPGESGLLIMGVQDNPHI